MLEGLLQAIRLGPSDDGVRDLLIVNTGNKTEPYKDDITGPIWRLRVKRGSMRYLFSVTKKIVSARLTELPGFISPLDTIYMYEENFHMKIDKKRSVWFCIASDDYDTRGSVANSHYPGRLAMIDMDDEIMKNWDDVWSTAEDCKIVQQCGRINGR